jgi:pyruvate dehydrogenase E1 component alpha subunit
MPKLLRASSLSIFQRMLMMRYFEEAVIRLHQEGRFVAHYHVYIGQEATGAAVLETLGDEDLICTTHRNHGHLVGRGSDPGRLLAEILGRVTGLNQGRGGTLHATDRSRGFLSTSGIVGGCAGLATGAAFGIKTKGEPHIAVGFFGDGALEEGLVVESFNIAALWKLPVIYVCENNSAGAIGPQQGGYPTAITAATTFTRLPASFGITCFSVDGAEAGAVYEAASQALQHCRRGDGPVFIEASTVRWPGSNPLWPVFATVTDLDHTWAAEQIGGPHADWIRHHDPLLRMAHDIVESGYASREDLLRQDREARARIKAAVAFALDSPEPHPRTVMAHVFAQNGNRQ